MRAPFPMILAVALAAGELSAQQALVCPTSATSSGRPCDAFHYHVQMYRPDTKQRVEIYATPQFATQTACERARDARAAANAKVIEFLRGAKQNQFEPDRFGPCHCDMTGDKSSSYFLTDTQRAMQLRTVEETRLRLREKLLDIGLMTDSEVVRALDVDPPVTPQLGSPKFVAPPQNAAAAIVTSPDDLKSTKTIDTTKPSVAALDLPLVDIGAPASPPADPPASTPAPVASNGEPPPPAVETPLQPPITETKVEAEPTEEEILSAQETAERFVSYETQRIQNVLGAANAIADESVRSKIFDACMQRIQLLSNLRLLIEGSGMRGRLATAAREAETESERLILIAKLFGDDIKRHWAPKDATDVVFNVAPDIAAEPERVLRDTTGQYNAQQKKHALYLVLAQSQTTEDQRLWLSTVVEEFLR